MPADGLIRDFIDIATTKSVEFYRAVGYNECKKIEYSGLISIQEVMTVSKEIRKMIKNKSSAQEIKNKAIEEGMVTFKEDGIKRALGGMTRIQEVMRVAYGKD